MGKNRKLGIKIVSEYLAEKPKNIKSMYII